jgi:(S)-ureidoglycine aminohydrolase
MEQLGYTRSAHRSNHLVQTPDTFVRAPLPGMKQATAIVHIAPAAGAAFTEYTAEFETGGYLGDTPAQRFVYVLQGELTVTAGFDVHRLLPGHYAYIPQQYPATVAASSPSRAAVIEKPYEHLNPSPSPALFTGDEGQIQPKHLNDDPWLEVRALLPEDCAFDFAVNTMSFQPGATLPMVEVHIMEHGLLMLQGGGVYRLGDCWYPATAGDFIWMAPYCPQWFGSLGKTPAKYLLYKDWNRHPLPE